MSHTGITRLGRKEARSVSKLGKDEHLIFAVGLFD